LGIPALVALGWSAAAQQALRISTPSETGASPAAQSVASLPDSALHRKTAEVRAPVPLFGDRTPEASFDILPGSQQYIFNSAESQKNANEQRNWTLMTPEDILGISTAEKILKLSHPGDDASLTPEQRFLKRQDQQQLSSASNAWQRANTSLWHHDKNDADSLFESLDASQSGANAPGPGTRTGNSVFGNMNARGELRQKFDSTWASPFETPELLPKPTQAQLAGMDRFRAIMNPATPEKAPASVNLGLPIAPINRNLQTFPAFNPVGRAVTPLVSESAKPTGLTPLPGITGQQVTETKKTSPLVKPPPWMQDPLQSGNLPQRQF
jgi:hypothetical protein